MRRISTIATAVVIVLAVTTAAVQAGDDKPVMFTPDQLKWVPNPTTPGVSSATTWGNPEKGDHGAFHKFQPGFMAPLHTHSSDVHAVVLSGTMVIAGENGKEMKFPAGSFFSQPKGYKHTTKCMEGSDCMIYVEVDGKWDVNLVVEKK